MRACVRACVRARVCVRACVSESLPVCVCVSAILGPGRPPRLPHCFSARRVTVVNSDFHFDVMCAVPLPAGSFIYLLGTEQLPQSLLFVLLLLCNITCRFMIGVEYVSELITWPHATLLVQERDTDT